MMNLLQHHLIRFCFSQKKNVNLAKNYYSILEVSTTSDTKTIKKSYLKLVKIYHPDVNPGGKSKFTEIQEAYEILSHDQTKSYYDKNSLCRGNGSNSFNGSKDKSNYQYEKYQNYRNSKDQGFSNQSNYYQKAKNYYSQKKQQKKYDYYYKDSGSYKYGSSQEYSSFSNTYKTYGQQRSRQQFRRSNQNFQSQFDNYNKNQKSYQDRESQAKNSQQTQKLSPEQIKMRDKLRAMKGLTSYYSMFWRKGQIRYKDVMNMKNYQADGQHQQPQSQQDKNLKSIVPQKIRRFYQKIMQKIDKINPGSQEHK